MKTSRFGPLVVGAGGVAGAADWESDWDSNFGTEGLDGAQPVSKRLAVISDRKANVDVRGIFNKSDIEAGFLTKEQC